MTLPETQELGVRERREMVWKGKQNRHLCWAHLHILPDKSSISHNTHRDFYKGEIWKDTALGQYLLQAAGTIWKCVVFTGSGGRGMKAWAFEKTNYLTKNVSGWDKLSQWYWGKLSHVLVYDSLSMILCSWLFYWIKWSEKAIKYHIVLLYFKFWYIVE